MCTVLMGMLLLCSLPASTIATSKQNCYKKPLRIFFHTTQSIGHVLSCASGFTTTAVGGLILHGEYTAQTSYDRTFGLTLGSAMLIAGIRSTFNGAHGLVRLIKYYINQKDKNLYLGTKIAKKKS